MKKICVFKIILIISLVVMAVQILVPIKVRALDNAYFQPDMFDGYHNLEKANIGKAADPKDQKNVGGMIRKILEIVLAIVRTITLGWGIIMAVAIAVKYMTGSPQIKSQLKTDMPTYLVGALLLFGASGLMTLLSYFTKTVFKDSTP